jgi:hypothetical protein
MTLYALVIVLAANTTGFADRASWHASAADCRAQAALEMAHLELTGRPVASATCTPVSAHRLQPRDAR